MKSVHGAKKVSDAVLEDVDPDVAHLKNTL